MRLVKTLIAITLVMSLASTPALAWTAFGVGGAGGWDNINKSSTVTTVLDTGDFTTDIAAANVETALVNAYATWDNVETAPGLNFNFLPDDGGNYDLFDGPGDGPPWFDGYDPYTLDQGSNWNYANITMGGWLPEDYFGSPNVLAVTWSAQIYSGRSRKGTWHSELFFNDAWNWTDDAEAATDDYLTGLTAKLIDLETVALHELGHAIGLGHEDTLPSVMNSYYGGVQRDLFADDIAGLEALYSGSGGGGGKGGGKPDNPGRPNRMVVDGVEWFLTGVTYANSDALSAATVPGPATLGLLAFGAAALLKRRRAA